MFGMFLLLLQAKSHMFILLCAYFVSSGWHASILIGVSPNGNECLCLCHMVFGLSFCLSSLYRASSSPPASACMLTFLFPLSSLILFSFSLSLSPLLFSPLLPPQLAVVARHFVIVSVGGGQLVNVNSLPFVS